MLSRLRERPSFISSELKRAPTFQIEVANDSSSEASEENLLIRVLQTRIEFLRKARCPIGP